ncbi:MAG: tRNA (adenosine(37)-N6)-threonylcarbamoyltransferase complex dimerization subunit type 1 TsaB [Bacteroidales bacterium]|jgi:tRNA threonylcarbamoyladenosine biosynthesis protein TsaB|nr:tRNA (adenosine(37)-N6)-threonylcarbamoyltransferase complex dimerization subunit type 1 TsaB [Bacteroidales bacterium]
MILCLETATSLCSVALCDRKGVVALKEGGEGRSHASELTVFIDRILKDSGIKADQLEAVAVSKGPGSYTGLRIGVSAAKGITYASSIPLIGIDTTLSMYLGFYGIARDKYGINQSDLFCPALDARRMEIYYSVFDASGRIVKTVCAEVVDTDFLSDLPASSRIFIFGDGSAKCRGVVRSENIFIECDFRISATYMRSAAYDALDNKHFEDVAYFEPFYLKDFLTSKPVKNIPGK